MPATRRRRRKPAQETPSALVLVARVGMVTGLPPGDLQLCDCYVCGEPCWITATSVELCGSLRILPLCNVCLWRPRS
jgi:hypothetical protein